jgi:hypothetical protein
VKCTSTAPSRVSDFMIMCSGRKEFLDVLPLRFSRTGEQFDAMWIAHARAVSYRRWVGLLRRIIPTVG